MITERLVAVARLRMGLCIAAFLLGCVNGLPRHVSGSQGGSIPKRISVHLRDGVEMEFALIPPGAFLMGSPEGEEGDSNDERQHEVVLTKAYYMGVTEVTQAQWKAVMGLNPSYFKGDGLPVDNVSWDDAVAFCEKLSELAGVKHRLPTEAEWERACRGGTTDARYGSLDEVAWHCGNSGGTTNPAGAKKANAYGLHDTLGNVHEWCSDWDGEYTWSDVAVEDPTGAGSGHYRVVRGGSWGDDPSHCRAAYRDGCVPSASGFGWGLRVARAS